jgi:Tetratricopeptide repeat
METREIARFRNGPDHDVTAGVNVAVGAFFRRQREFAKAEPCLREALAHYVKTKPDDWRRYQTEGMLGACLVGQKNYAEAERHLLTAYTGMKARPENVPPNDKDPLGKTMEQLIQLYDAWGQKDKAAEWRRERVALVLDDPFAPQ